MQFAMTFFHDFCGGFLLQVTGHCFINTESIINIRKRLTLGLKTFVWAKLGLRLAFMNV